MARDPRRNESLAIQIATVRKKYGRYPAVIKEWNPKQVVTRKNAAKQTITSYGAITVKPCKVLPGMEKVKIPDLPDLSKLSEAQKAFYADNREDFRRRVRKMLPRFERKNTYSRDLRERVNSTRIAA